MKKTRFPDGWNEDRVEKVLDHYQNQSDEEAVAEDEASWESTTHVSVEVPIDLLEEIRELIAKRQAS